MSVDELSAKEAYFEQQALLDLSDDESDATSDSRNDKEQFSWTNTQGAAS
jgi:hypothetical protein